MQLTGGLQPPPGLGQKILIGSFFDDDLSLDPKIGAFFGEDLFGQNRPIFWRRPFWDQIGPYLILGKQLHRPVIMDRPRNSASAPPPKKKKNIEAQFGGDISRTPLPGYKIDVLWKYYFL